MFVSVTRLRIRSFRYLPAFLLNTFLSERQAKRAPGFLGGRLLIDSGLTFWTLSAWDSESSMKAFRGSGSHARIMPRLVEWCNEASYTHWISEEGSIPSWPEAHERLVRDGRLSHVNHASSAHEARHFAAPRPVIGRDLKAAAKDSGSR
jgi:hypothetical protein